MTKYIKKTNKYAKIKKYNKKTKKNKRVKLRIKEKNIKGGSCCLYEEKRSRRCWVGTERGARSKQYHNVVEIGQFNSNSGEEYSIYFKNHAYKHMDEVIGRCDYDGVPNQFFTWIVGRLPNSIVYEITGIHSSSTYTLYTLSTQTLLQRLDDEEYFKDYPTRYIGMVYTGGTYTDTDDHMHDKAICIMFNFNKQSRSFFVFNISPIIYTINHDDETGPPQIRLLLHYEHNENYEKVSALSGLTG